MWYCLSLRKTELWFNPNEKLCFGTISGDVIGWWKDSVEGAFLTPWIAPYDATSWPNLGM